ncbi:MAG: Na/Pi cotransporter family protein [Beijerinckiaceae bacterium]|nr:Na/Pi cotransporter family protein [Beijerinckiaceae bacterium]
MFQNTGLISLIAGIVLLVWSIRFIRDQMLLTFGDRLRGILRRVGQSSLLASLMGVMIAAALQSGAAASLIVTAFAERGFLSSVAAVSAVFGADLGSALMVQLLSLRSAVLAPALLSIGGAVALGLLRDNAKPYGTIAFGFGLVLLALSIIGVSLSGIAYEPLFIAVLERIGSEPLIGMAIAALITLALHSSVAMILALSALAATGALDSAACLALVLGANIGSSLIPLMLSARAGAPTRRVLTANLLGRIGMAAIFLIGATVTPHIFDLWTGQAARLVVDVHLIFNLTIALVGLPIARPLAAMLEKIWPDSENDESRIRVQHLDELALKTPSLALVAAAREALRVADRVERMLEAAMRYFKNHDKQSEKELKTLDDEVDFLQEEIKLYLVRLGGHHLEDEDRNRAFELILFTTNLEHAGDIIDKSLVPLARKQARLGVRFSEDGWREIKQMHAAVSAQLQLAMTLFFSRDLDQARHLVAAKDDIRERERSAMRSHLDRLERGTPETIATSALHLDILRDLKRISAHLTAIAYPLLERSDQILTTRLRAVK